MSLSRARWILLICLLLFAVRGGLYIILLPLNEMPDELEHVLKITLARDWDRVKDDKKAAEELMREVAAEYYFIANGLDKRPDKSKLEDRVPPPERRKIYFPFCGWVLRTLGADTMARTWYLSRFLSLLSGLAVILLAWATARTLAPERPVLAAATVCFLSLLPQFGAMSAVASTDKPAELAGALLFFLMAGIARKGGWWRWAGVALVILSLPLVKKTAFFFLAVAALAAVPHWRRFVGRRKHKKFIVWGIPTLLSLGFLGASFFPPLATLVYRLIGMPFFRIWHPAFDPLIFRQPGIVNTFTEYIHPLSLSFWHQVYFNLQSLFQSWWGFFGFQTLPLDNRWYWLALLLSVLALAGLVRLLFRPGREWRMEPWQGRALGFLAVGAGLNLVVTLTRHIVFAPGSLSQGRYMYPSLTAWALIGVLGFLALWPPKVRMWALAAGMLVLALMDLAAMWKTIVPYYYFTVLGT